MPRERKKKSTPKSAPMPPHDIDFGGMKRMPPFGGNPNMMGMHPGGPGGPPMWGDPGMHPGGYMQGPPHMEFGPRHPMNCGPMPPHTMGHMMPQPPGMMQMDDGMMCGPPTSNWRPYGGPPMHMQGPPMPPHNMGMEMMGGGPGPPMGMDRMGPCPPQGMSPGPPPGISPGPPMGGGGGMNNMMGIMNKIYPPGQPVVINSANPSAPPIYPCGVCRKEVTESEQAILCESGCNFWFHRMCTGLTDRAYHLLTTEVYAEWACEECIRTKNVPLVKFKS